MERTIVRTIASNSMIAALYVVVTLITYPISFLSIQFRFAEILVLLCFFRKDFAFGIVAGTAIVNLASPIGVVDVIFGTLATLIAVLGIMFCKWLAIACLLPVVSNAFIVGFELWKFMGEPFWVSVGFVALGEFVVMVVAYIVYTLLKKRKSFFELIRAKQNVEFKW